MLQEVHDAGHAGHPGRDRTLARLRPRFYWPNMAEYVREYVLTCPSCQMSKARRGAAPGLLQPLPIPDVPWEAVGMDFIGPLPETPDGKDFILTCVCLLTKMVKLVPMRRPDAEGTARAFNERVLSQMGWPRMVVSDRDPKFMSAFWQRLMQLMRTRLNTSTAYHPQTDGQAERMNRLAGEVLRHFVCADQTDWDELLPMVEFAINSSPNRSTGFTPFYLNYGREPMVPADLLSPAGELAAGGARCYSHPAMIGRVSRPWAGGTRDQGASREGVDHGAPSPWLRPPSPQLSVPGSPHPGPAPRPAGHATPTTWWGTWGSLAA